MRTLSVVFALLQFCVAAAVVPLPQYIGKEPPSDPLPACSGAYRIDWADGECVVTASDAAGLFYAQQTLRQLRREYGEQVPSRLYVQDFPRYEWRALHLDVSRHFFGKEVVCELLDRMAEIKLNRLHLHLTDGPGWRLEIKAFPRLTEVGAWRLAVDEEKGWNWQDHRMGNHYERLYGGFYTQEEMRSLVAYAAERHIVLVPEIDMPGHSCAALQSYPWLAHPAYGTGGFLYSHDYLRVGDPAVKAFACQTLEEVMGLFPPGTPIHVGGDEVDPSVIPVEEQRRFLQELADLLLSRGYPVVAWDEAADFGVRGQYVMFWHAVGADRIEELGMPAILCPADPLFFDVCGEDASGSPRPPEDGVRTTKDVFVWRPPVSPYVIGIQANLWTEYVRTREELFYMAFPRAYALGERAWGSPERPYDEFEADVRRLLAEKR